MTNNRELAAVTAATLLYADLLVDDAFCGFDGSLTALTRLIQELTVIAKVDFPEAVTAEELVDGFYASQEAVACGDAAPDWWEYV